MTAGERPEPISSSFGNGGLFEDIPRWIWVSFLAAWGFFFLLIVFFFATSPTATFMVSIVELFGLMAFALPITLGAQSRCTGNKCTGMIQTRTGPLSQRAAAAQMALIPAAVVIGFAGFIAFAM